MKKIEFETKAKHIRYQAECLEVFETALAAFEAALELMPEASDDTETGISVFLKESSEGLWSDLKEVSSSKPGERLRR